MDDERTTGEVIEVLGEDCDRSFEELSAAIDAGATGSGLALTHDPFATRAKRVAEFSR
jgi:hypothetical protein